MSVEMVIVGGVRYRREDAVKLGILGPAAVTPDTSHEEEKTALETESEEQEADGDEEEVTGDDDTDSGTDTAPREPEGTRRKAPARRGRSASAPGSEEGE